jgi:fatty-acyl-CoA synthase
MTQQAPISGLSHVKGSTARPLIEATIPGFLREVVRRHGQRTAAVFTETGERWSYAEFAERVDTLAAGLLAIGVYRGDRVGIWAPNCPEWLLVQFATARIGAILVTINPAYQTSELEYALKKASVKALFTARHHRGSDYVGMLASITPELATAQPGYLRSARLPDLQSVVQLGPDPIAGAYSFAQVLSRAQPGSLSRLNAISSALKPNDPINIQFTSGTTGSPKGATLTHRNIVNNAVNCARRMRLSPGEALCIPVPLYHCFGMVLGSLAACAYGVKMVFPGAAFDPLATLQALETEGCNAVHGVPTMFSSMLDHPEFERFDLSSLRTGIMAGAPCPEPLMRRVIKQMHCPEITIAYGMTETSPISFQSDTDDPLTRRVTTVGRIQPHAECKVVDEDGRTLAINQQGELLTRGYLVMQGYWNDAERSADVLKDGWMHTGDLAVIDADGYCRITGRSKDMLIRGGENVYPAEVEDFLSSHPDIAQIQVFGLPDTRLGEEVAAWVILRPGALLNGDEIRAWCKGKIAYFKVPRHIHFAKDMPLTATGKPQKFKMRDTLMSKLGLSDAP